MRSPGRRLDPAFQAAELRRGCATTAEKPGKEEKPARERWCNERAADRHRAPADDRRGAVDDVAPPQEIRLSGRVDWKINQK